MNGISAIFPCAGKAFALIYKGKAKGSFWGSLAQILARIHI